jgi:hypothetical protein
VEFTKLQFQVHELLEEAKTANSIETHETTRLTDLAKALHTQVEQIQLIKEYRTTNIARSFVRVFLLMCPAMYGVYFSFVLGNVESGPGQAGLEFTLLLMLISIVLLLLLVNVERAMEDPCTTEYKGDYINVEEELQDTNERLELIREYCSTEGRSKIHFRMKKDKEKWAANVESNSGKHGRDF